MTTLNQLLPILFTFLVLIALYKKWSGRSKNTVYRKFLILGHSRFVDSSLNWYADNALQDRQYDCVFQWMRETGLEEQAAFLVPDGSNLNLVKLLSSVNHVVVEEKRELLMQIDASDVPIVVKNVVKLLKALDALSISNYTIIPSYPELNATLSEIDVTIERLHLIELMVRQLMPEKHSHFSFLPTWIAFRKAMLEDENKSNTRLYMAGTNLDMNHLGAFLATSLIVQTLEKVGDLPAIVNRPNLTPPDGITKEQTVWLSRVARDSIYDADELHAKSEHLTIEITQQAVKMHHQQLQSSHQQQQQQQQQQSSSSNSNDAKEEL